MRRNLLVLSLAGLTLLASTSDTFAQRRSGGGGRGASTSAGRATVNRGNGGNYAGRGYGGGYYAGRGYGGGYYGGGYGGGYYGGGILGLGLLGGGYYGGYGYSPYYQGYSDAPAYYSDPLIAAQAPQVRQSSYPPVQDFANVTVLVPTADAQVWFQNAATTQQGTQRLFNSPSLTPNEKFTYTIKARWMENGKVINQERMVNVQSGQNVRVDFRQNGSENLALPMPGLPTAIPQK
jgi:uncharacterized protein (TIGR03000 family)